MKHFDKELQHLADNGYRTSEDWLTLGRAVESGSAPRTSITSRGRALELFSRDQTKVMPRAPRRERPVAATPAPEATPA